MTDQNLSTTAGSNSATPWWQRFKGAAKQNDAPPVGTGGGLLPIPPESELIGWVPPSGGPGSSSGLLPNPDSVQADPWNLTSGVPRMSPMQSQAGVMPHMPIPDGSALRRGMRPYEPAGHLVLENLPVDKNTMKALYDFYKEFGEISTIHCVPNVSMAYVGFRNSPAAYSAASSAATRPPLGSISIKVTYHHGNPPRISKPAEPVEQQPETYPPTEVAAARPLSELGPAPGGIVDSGLVNGGARPSGHMVMESEEAKKQREQREAQMVRSKERDRLLTQYTGTVKTLIEKMNSAGLKEESRDAYAKLLAQVKEKMTTLQQEIDAEKKKEQAAVTRVYAARMRAFERQKRDFAAKKQQAMTLDLRSRCVITSELPEELQQIDVLAEYLKEMDHKQLVDVVWVDNRKRVVLRFATHEAAEQLIASQPGFESAWISNKDVQGYIDSGCAVEHAEALAGPELENANNGESEVVVSDEL